MNITTMAQMPMAAACDDLFLPLFGWLSTRGVPTVGIIISALMNTVLFVLDIPVYVWQRRRVSKGPPGN